MKICIVTHYAYGALTGEDSGHIGGVERQTALMSEWLVKQGHQVSVITWNEGSADTETINGIQIIKLCRVDDGLPGLRFFTPRWTSLLKALKKADAEVYYHNCAEYVTGQIAMWCQQKNKKFVYSVASDADCEMSLPKLRTFRDRFFFKYGLRHSHKIICQSNKQKKLLADNYNFSAQTIPMPGTPPEGIADKSIQFNQQKVVWVGRVQTVKRIEWLIDIAEKLPNINFDVVGPTDHNKAYTEEILPRAHKLSNINFLGKLSKTEMHNVYKNASLLCSTSIYEGFPNTYLEAWSYGVPLVCTVDPDDIVKRFNLGASSTKQADLIQAIDMLLNDREKWSLCAKNCENYYLEHHEMNKVQKKFESVFYDLSTEKNTQQHFAQQSTTWSNYYTQAAISIDHFDLQTRTQITLGHLSSVLNKEQITLDVGCGSGDATAMFNKCNASQLYAIDFSSQMIEKASHKYPEINFKVGNATKLEHAKQSITSLISLGTIEYIIDHEKALLEFNRVLKDQGELVISIPNKSSLFRRLRSLDKKLMAALKVPLKKISNNINTESKYYHKKWKAEEFSVLMQAAGFNVEHVTYCTYGFLSPRLTTSKFNLLLCTWLNKNIASSSYLSRKLAHTIVIKAVKIK